jgi:hypothetical protein
MKNILFFALFLSTIIMSGCSQDGLMQDKSYITKEIEKANYCETKEDCVDAGGKCPFGCYTYVNKGEVDRIKTLLDSYESTCIFDCAYCPYFECKNNKCEPICG